MTEHDQGRQPLLNIEDTSNSKCSITNRQKSYAIGVFFLLLVIIAPIAIVLKRRKTTSSSNENSMDIIYSYKVTTALNNITLIDGNGGAPLSHRTILITESGTIANIFLTGSQEIPATAKIYDLSGKYVMPGLIDSHVHLETDLDPSNFTIYLEWALRGGVTTVREMGGDVLAMVPYAAQALINSVPSPRIYYSALFGDWRFMNDSRVQAASHGFTAGIIPWFRAVTDETQLPLSIREAKQIGVTGCKTYANLNGTYIKDITEEVHRQGLKMYSHSTVFPAKPSEVINAGVDTMSHAAYLAWEVAKPVPDDYTVRFYYDYSLTPYNSPDMIDLLKLMAEKGTILDATVWIYTQFDSASKHSPSGFEVSNNQTIDPNIGIWSANITGLANDMGVRVVAGTDDMGSPFYNDTIPLIHTELETLVTLSHFTPLQAITAGTRRGAEVLGIEKDYGTVAIGKVADLLILNNDPSLNIQNTKSIYFVMKQGFIYD